MKKKILSLFLALAMCLSLLPTAAFAADGAQDPAEPGEEILAPEQLGDPEKDPDPEQENQQEDSTVKQDEAVATVQAMIDDLPDAEELDGMDDEALDAVYEAFQTACDAYYDALTEEQQAQLKNTEKLAALSDWFSQSAALAVETHEHYLCGGDTCNEEGHALEDGKTAFKAWDKTAATTTGGAYYLTGDVYGFTVPEGVNLTLCLNGFSITGNWDGPIVTVEPGATLTLCNCKSSGYIGHDRNVYGAGVFVGEKDDSMEGNGQNSAAFYMYGGTIGGNSDSATKAGDYIYGSGVVVMGGTFYMYGGAIKNNSVNTVTNKSYGGGVSVFNNGTFNMSGGTITGNTGYYGGGVSVGLGVGINHAENKIGGTFNMSGGRITGNVGMYKAGGAYVGGGSDTIFTVSGTAQITDNYLGDPYTSSTANNVYLLEGNTKFEVEDAIINVGTLDSSASIGVTTEKGEQIVATGVSPAAEKCFTSDSSNYRLKYDSAAETLTMVASAHEDHPICGASCTHNNEHPAITNWKGVANLRTISRSGNYYLTGNVTLTEGWVCRYDVTLCLNGYSIIANGDFDAITVGAGKTFTLCDCVGGGEISHTEGKTGRGVKVQGTFNLYGGTITGNKCSTSSSYGSGVYVDSGAFFNMHGGSITGNENTVSHYGYGGGVYVNGSTFNMTGGSITKNTAMYGAGVWTNVSFTVSGAAKIIDNSKDNAASNVYLAFNPSITIGGGGLDKDARIGVTTGDIRSGEYVTVATGAANSCTANNFSADKGGELGIKVETSADGKTNVNLYNGLPHIHYRCNGKDEDGNNACTKIGGHTDDKVLEFKPWAETNSLPTTSGEYYLTKDVTLDSTWSFNGTNSSDGQVRFVLCLNGHSITLSESATGNVLDIGSYATLALCDCNGSKAGHGEITGAKGNYSGVNIASKGAFAMYGGTIRRNAAGVSNNDLFHMFGGTITGNHRGVYANGDNFIIAGDVTISGNGANGNIYLTSGKTITVSGALSKTAQIGVSTESAIPEGGYVTVAQGKAASPAYTLTTDDLNAFSSDANYDKQLLNGKIVFTNGTMHQHPICGTKGCEESGHDDKLWLPISDESALRAATAGYYYLTKDIILWNGTWEPKDSVVLCLNGCNIEANVDSDTIVVNSGRTFTLTDCKGTTGEYGKITHWGDYKNGRGVSVNGQNAEFIMYGGNISGNTVTGNGGGVYVNNRATFTMYGGEITGNKATGTNNCGGGVYVSADATNTNRTSTFNMYGGTISGNEATDGSGGGVYVYYSTFNMYGGTIGSANTGNKAYGKGGGGVYVFNGTFTMSGSAAVSGNSTADSAGTGHGGGVYVDGIGGTFTMSGSAAVSGNTASGNGGGVYVENRGSSFNMSGSAAVSDNTASGSGGGVYVNCSTFTMNAGTISGNETTGANSDGGGVCVAGLDNDTSTFTMKNGTISGNSAKNGGGVYVSQSTFTMSNGTISGNNAAYSGGGVYVTGNSSNSGAFTMTGGTVTGNNAASTNGSGGVYVAIDANMTVFGSVQITDNWKNGTLNSDGSAYEKGESGTASNLYLGNGKTVAIGTGGLTGEAKIGITTSTAPESTAENTVQFATGAAEGTDYTAIFTPDVTNKGYSVDQNGTGLYLNAHQHSWKYVNDGPAAIKVICDNTVGCNLGRNSSVTYTLTAPTDLTYDGKGKPATVNPYSVEIPNGVTLPEPSAISYTQTEPTLQQLEATAVPTNAGTYTASITMGTGENKATASVTYEIKKATPKADDFIFSVPGNLTYDGSPKTATVTSTKIDASYVTVKYYQDGTKVSEPTNAGTYTVKIDVTESGNYFAASGLNANDWMFAIAKNTTTPTVTLDQYYSLTYKKSQLTPPVTVTINGKSLTENVDYTVTYGKNIDAGELAGSVTINPMGNYEFRQIVRSFTIDARYIAVTASDKTSRVGQNLVALTYTCTKGLPYEGDTFTGELATNANKNTAGTYQITQGTLSLGNNYNIAFTPGTYTVEDKQPQTGFKFENAAVTKTYGNADFTITATGAVTGSSVTYSSSNEAVATVDSTGKVTIVGAGTAKIIATASATDDYAEATAEYTLTVSPKTLTADDLEFTANSTFTKEYDGTTNCTTATVQINSDAKVNNGDALPEVKGAYAYDSKDATGATKVTFTTERTENTNYILPEGLTVEHAANITKRVLTVGEVTTTPKTYNTLDNALDCVTGIELIGTVSGETLRFYTSAETGGDYGIYETKFDNANAGQNKTITGTVALLGKSALASNYTFKVDGKESSTAPFTATGDITEAPGGSKGSVERTQKFTDENPKTETIAWTQLLPAGQTWNYGSEYYSASSVTVDHGTDDNGALTYTITGGKEDDVVVFTVSAKCNNYQDFTYTVRVTLTARDPQALEFKGVENGKVTKTYGDQPFTQTVTGEKTTVTYTSSNARVATVDNTGKVTIVGAGQTTITATAELTDVYASASASYALTVNKLRIPVPTKGKNELEYTGREQTYLPDGLDLIYCTIESNKATNVIAGGSWHNAEVRLTDWSNTEWADGADSIAHRPYPFRITPKPVTVTALDKKITAGQPAPELTSADYTVTGLIGNDTLGGISLYYADPSDLSKAVTPDTGKAGTYAIVITEGGTGSNNYAPTFVNGTLTIASRPSGGVVAVTYPVNVPGETERGSVSSNVKNASKGSTVTITVEPEDGFQLADLTVTDKDGNELPLTDKGDGKYTFTMPAGKVEVNATFAEKIETSPFADVSTDAYYYEAVKWAAEQGITGGVGGGLFAPDQSCTRAQIVTFLWRAAGSPEPKSMRSFSDVPEDSYYAKAVAWAVENGITVGTSATTFSPDATCTRAQGVTFLFRAAKASADGAPAFRDVAADAYYAAAVKWATDNSVTNGIGGGLFGSDNDCTRAQIVTFLWRLYAGK